jgi:hypothetical protein
MDYELLIIIGAGAEPPCLSGDVSVVNMSKTDSFAQPKYAAKRQHILAMGEGVLQARPEPIEKRQK